MPSAENGPLAVDHLTDLVAIHTPELVRLATDGISKGQHYYCVECGVLSGAEAGPGHVASVIVGAGYARATPPQ